MFSTQIKLVLKERKLTASKLAEMVKVSKPYMSELLRNKKRWNEALMLKVCEALNIQIEFKASL
jgi:transcriptional regulator with XRE-family HTH domain